MEIAGHNMHEAIPYDSKIEWLGGRQSVGAYIHLDVDTSLPTSYFLEVVVSNLSYLQTSSNDHKIITTSCGNINILTNSSTYFRTANVVIDNLNQSKWKLTHDHYSGNVYDLYDIDNDIMYAKKSNWGNDGYRGISLFWQPNISTSYASPSHIHSLRFKDATTQLDLIPVRVGSTGFMYDKVSGRMFGNAGSGSFILGPDVEEG